MVLGEAFHRRAAKLLSERLAALGKHAALLFDPANIRYISGLPVAPTDRPLAACVWANGNAALFVPQLEAERLASGWIRDIRWYAEYPAAEESPVRWMAREAGGPLVVDAGASAAAWRSILEEVEEAEHQDLVAEQRMIKSPAEIALIERAAEYADLALERAFARLTTGSTERDVVAEIVSTVDGFMRQELGDDYDAPGPAITGSVQSGTRTALPSAPTSGRPLARGDCVIVEFTANVGGYHAQAGCTFFVGDPLRDVVHWVESAMHAQAAALEAMSVGATAESIDLAARKTLERLGLGANIRHRTGHGIGLAVREAPWLTRSQTTPLEAGMVLVARPGIYISGRIGARNTRTVVIEPDGPRVLNPRIDRWDKMEARLKEF
ncbi:MAG: Xaa-Pro peptidase family protein [Sphaerobacter sp.]|nr:Xaa-Pro peptidase family protein [Sphaerobacter sp.]